MADFAAKVEGSNTATRVSIPAGGKGADEGVEAYPLTVVYCGGV